MSEPITWITKNGKHIPIYADKVSDDERKKSREIAQNEKEAQEKSGKALGKYAQMNDVFEMCRAFYEDTGITNSYSAAALKSLDKESFGQALDTIAKWYEKYGDDLGVTHIYIPSEEEFLSEHDDSSLASMERNGTMNLNPAFFRKSPKEQRAVWKDCVESEFHPKGDETSVITHEVGHAVFFSRFKNGYDRFRKEHIRSDGRANPIDDYFVGYNILCNGEMDWEPQYHEKNDKNNDWSFTRYCMAKIDAFEEYLSSDKKIKDWFQGAPTGGVFGIVTPTFFSSKMAISRYAAEDYFEAMAEAFQDVMDNGEKAHYVSKLVYRFWYEQDF